VLVDIFFPHAIVDEDEDDWRVVFQSDYGLQHGVQGVDVTEVTRMHHDELANEAYPGTGSHLAGPRSRHPRRVW